MKRVPAASVVLGVALALGSCAGDRRDTPAPSESNKAVTTKARPPLASPYRPEFWQIWSDGQAELNSYDLVQPRYGKPREGVAVAIFVTETFSNSLRVKSDPGRRSAADEFPVMKLNLAKDYQTGIYDYNEMLSSFIALEPVNNLPYGHTTKVSFSSQEWCGHVYSQLVMGKRYVDISGHSYFDGEADGQRRLATGARTTEDSLMLWARGMALPFMGKPGKMSVQTISSLEASRAKHEAVTFDYIEYERTGRTQRLRVPAGEFDVEPMIARSHNLVRTYYVETSQPRRVIRWETSTGEKADLVASARLKYWELNGPGGEEKLKELGLKRRGPRMP